MNRLASVVVFACLMVNVQADETEPFVLPAVEERYASESTKLDATVAKSKKTAADARLKAYKDALVQATKSGDFDKAQAVKARIEQLEKEPDTEPVKAPKKPRPKDTVKFGGHSYALIKEPATWHVAQRRCEEMGGHLLVIDNLPESQFAIRLADGSTAWVGATDEEAEGKWVWVNGRDNGYFPPHQINSDDGASHFLAVYRNEWHDMAVGQRQIYICEWDR